jgi:replicative DNA helicase
MESNNFDYEPIGEIVKSVQEELAARRENKAHISGISTGFTKLDKETSGFYSGELIFIGARPAMGKTALMLEMAGSIAIRSGTETVWFSLETPKEYMASRLICMEADVEMTLVRHGTLDPEKRKRFLAAADALGKSMLIIDDTPRLTIRELTEKCRMYKEKYDVKIVFIDYLQLIFDEQEDASFLDEMEDVVICLKNLAKELNVPIVVETQIPGIIDERVDYRPLLTDFDIPVIEEVADKIVFLYRQKDYDNTLDDNTAEVIIAKQKNGPVAMVELEWVPEYAKFREKIEGKT